MWAILSAVLGAGCPAEDRLNGRSASGSGEVAATVEKPQAKPIHGPISGGPGDFVKPEPIPPDFHAPPGTRVCRYQLKETTSELLGGAPFAGSIIILDYVLVIEAPDRAEIRVLRARTKSRRENHQAELDSARPGDQKRVRGGADTLVYPEIPQAFALLEAPIGLDLKGGRPVALHGAGELRAALLRMHPPGLLAEPAYPAQAARVFKEGRIAARLHPLLTDVPDLEEAARHETTARLEQDGLRAKGRGILRVTRRGERLLLQLEEALAPDGRVPDPPLPGPKLSRLAGKRSRTVEWVPGDPCFLRAAESLETRVDWTGRLGEEPEQTLPLDRARTRIWSREAT